MILVTGGSGFIWSHLIKKLLLEGEKIINVDDFNDYYDLSIKITNTLDSTNNIGLRTDHIQLEKKEN